MSTIEVLAVSPVLPVDDLLAHPEGGPTAAAQALGALLPDAAYQHVGSATWAEGLERADDAVLVSTFGPTTMFLRRPVRGLAVPAGMTTFSVSYQITSSAWGVDVAGPGFERLVALSPGALDYAEGAPLPFEEALGVDEEEPGHGSFDDTAYAVAAARWMFGCFPLEPGPLDQVDLGDQPLHVFTPERRRPATPVG